MVIYQQPIFCSYLGKLIYEVDHIGIITIQKIDLEALNAHLCKVLAESLDIALQSPIARPKNDTHSSLIGIGDYLLEVYLGNTSC